MDMNLNIENLENLVDDPEPQLDQEKPNTKNNLTNVFT